MMSTKPRVPGASIVVGLCAVLVAGSAKAQSENRETTFGLESACPVGRWDDYDGLYSDVWGDGNYAYLPNRSADGNPARVHVIDVSNPGIPQLASTFFLTGANANASPQDVKVGDGLLFIILEGSDGNGSFGDDSVVIVDIRDPTNPVQVATIRLPGNPPFDSFVNFHNGFYDSGFLYLANSATPIVVIVDLTSFDPDNPPAEPIAGIKWVVTGVGTSFVHDITVDNGRLYAAAWDSGLWIYDVSDVANTFPMFLGSTPGSSTHSMWPTDDGRFVVTGEERPGGGIKVYEITDFGGFLSLTLRDSLSLSGAFSVHNQIIVGNRLYNSWYERGLQIFDIDAGGLLNFVAEFDTSNSGLGNWGVYALLGSDRILLSDGQDGLFVMAVAPGECVCEASNAPRPDVIQAKNRYLSFNAGEPGRLQAVRVTFVDLPGAHAALNGTVLWVGPPADVSELSGKIDNTPPTFKAAELGCTPTFLDWSRFGTVYVPHEGIVPGGVYDIQVVGQACELASEASFSVPLTLTQAKWGDAVGPFDGDAGSWTAPDGNVSVAFDVVAILDKFSNRPGAPLKSRADIEPGVPDQKVNITDVTRGLDAFGGQVFPFAPNTVAPCP